MAVTIQGPPWWRRASPGEANASEGRPTHRPHLGRWALVGALWGLASMVPAMLPHAYYELVGYRLGRTLTWLLPSWVTVRALDALGLASIEPQWLQIGLLVAGAVLLGAAAGLALWWLYEAGQRMASPH